MTSGLNGWLNELADKQIPILRHRRDQVLEILTDEIRASSECQPVILSDPGMAANLFRMMNQDRVKANRLPVTTVTSLISLFGVSKLIQAIESMTCLEDLGLPENNLKGIQRCFKQSWYCTQFAMKWVQDRGVREPEEVHVAAVLQSLPELMLWCYGDDILPIIEHRAYYQCDDYYKEVKKVLGCHKREIGVALAQQWALPEIAGFGFESDYNSFTSATAVALAALLARLSQHGWYGKDMHFFLQKAMHYFGEKENAASKHIHQQVIELVDDEMEFGY
ncbi:MAG: HDOD domain-containing protein, partial [Gammaproteobacteria bacterium]|nr:HDOD domain-containing protein [Gammaproteobacteria bacterium]